ncbi:hypothetical protein HDV00_012134 [Rhizophlyctis rosea]|nr:hypothetical protein HDV00_012134 [Rhizophlyctis rosea]
MFRYNKGSSQPVSTTTDVKQTKPIVYIPSQTTLNQWIDDAVTMSKSDLPRNDFIEMGKRARTFQKLFNLRYTPFGRPREGIAHSIGGLEKVAEIDHAIMKLEQNMYPFIKDGKKFTSASDLLASYHGRGIVMATGNWHFRFARHCIVSLRYMGSKLPIQVFYAGKDDLKDEYKEELRQIEGVTVLDLADYMDIKGPQVNGWAVKPFSMLASSFAEMIFIDADALFFQPPEVMFDFERYKRTGAIFFRDRTIGWGMTETLNFMNKFIKEPSEYAKKHGRVLNLKSLHEGESGVIVYDKRAAFHGLLTTCKMNSNPWREFMYKEIHGDKESYWFSQELLKLPYAWVPGGGGTVGYAIQEKGSTYVCGGLYHPDENYKPLWWNGGVTMNKYFEEKGKGMVNFTHYATDRKFEKLDWLWEQEDRPFCLKPPGREDVGELTKGERELTVAFQDIWKKLEAKKA